MSRVEDFLRRAGEAFTASELGIGGDWTRRSQREQADRSKSEGPVVERTYHIWKAEARCDEGLVALVYAETPELMAWAKSERAMHSTLPVSLSFFPQGWQKEDRVQVVWEGRGGSVRCNVRMKPADPPGQTRLGGLRAAKRTGQAHDLVEVSGGTTARFGALFLSEDDVELERNGMWRLRSKLAKGLEPALAKLLTRGRSGTLTELELAGGV